MTIEPEWAEPRDFPDISPMPGEPWHTPFGAQLRELTAAMAPHDRAHGYAHAHLCEAMMRGGIELAQAFDPDDPWAPFEPVLDPAACPAWALPWLAQLAGVQFTGAMTEEDQRAAIVDLRAQRRGTPGLIRAAVTAYLTGDAEVEFRERDGGDPYALEIVTRPDETPDPAAVAAALRATVPAGLVWDFHTVAGWDYQQWEAEAAAEDYAKQRTDYTTYSVLRDH